MSPLQIEILLHYHCFPSEHEIVHRNPPIWPETRMWFLAEGLLAERSPPSPYGATYECTERGRAWIEHVCNLPLPEQQWRMP